jgi:hypothetical protein
VTMGPVREAHLLLPPRFDPFQDLKVDDESWIGRLVLGPDSDDENFDPAKQRSLLGSRLGMRSDTPESDAEWNWQIQSGGSFRQGNVATTNVQGEFKAERHSRRGDLSARVGAVLNQVTQEAETTNNRRAFGNFIVDRNLRGRWLLYASEDLEYDEARKIDLLSVSSVGLGFRFVDRLKARWVLRTGPSVSYWDYAEDSDTPNVVRSGWLVESEYRRLLGKALRFELMTKIVPDFQTERQLRVTNQGALVFPIGDITSHWNWKIGLNQEYQLDPAQNTKSTDVEGYFAITYAN